MLGGGRRVGRRLGSRWLLEGPETARTMRAEGEEPVALTGSHRNLQEGLGL